MEKSKKLYSKKACINNIVYVSLLFIITGFFIFSLIFGCSTAQSKGDRISDFPESLKRKYAEELEDLGTDWNIIWTSIDWLMESPISKPPENSPSDSPAISGKINGKIGVNYRYTFMMYKIYKR